MAGGDRPVSWMKMHIFCTLMVWCILLLCRWHLRIVALKTNFAQPRRSADTSTRIICFCADTTACCRYPRQEFFWEAHLHLSCCREQKKAWEPVTNICIQREQFSQAQSSCNTWLLLLLEVYYNTVVRASIEGIRWFYGSWKEGFILIDRLNIAFDFLAVSLCTGKPSVLSETAFIPHRTHSTNSVTLWNLFLLCLYLSVPHKKPHLFTCARGPRTCLRRFRQ